MGVIERLIGILSGSDTALTVKEIRAQYGRTNAEADKAILDLAGGMRMKTIKEIMDEHCLKRVPFGMHPHTRMYYVGESQIKKWVEKNYGSRPNKADNCTFHRDEGHHNRYIPAGRAKRFK